MERRVYGSGGLEMGSGTPCAAEELLKTLPDDGCRTVVEEELKQEQ